MNLIDVLFSYAWIVPQLDGQLQELSAEMPTAAEVDETGLIVFQNDDGTQLFSLQLPLYDGGVL